MNEKFVQLEIWDLLESAKLAPLEVEWSLLWNGLDSSLVDLETSEQLQVAAEALVQMVEVFHHRSIEAFEELEAYTSDDGPVMGDGDFAPFVRQTMDIDFEQFLQPLVSEIRRPYTRPEEEDIQSLVEIVDKLVLIEAIEDVQEIDIEEQWESVIQIAHSENVSAIVEAIGNYIEEIRKIKEGVSECSGGELGIKDWCLPLSSSSLIPSISSVQVSFLELTQVLKLAPVETWLGLLLGGFKLSSKDDGLEDFYRDDVLVFAGYDATLTDYDQQ
jgi:hypothetical protein